jgi:CheY-like chemotaxis protein
MNGFGPLHAPALSSDSSEDDNLPWAGSGAGGSGRKRVLLVEDSLPNQKLMARLLQSLQLEVDVASDGLEAIEAVRRSLSTSPSPAVGSGSGSAFVAAGSGSGLGPGFLRGLRSPSAGPSSRARSSGSIGSSTGSLSGGTSGGGNGRPYDLILLDKHMPHCDGITATARIRALGSRAAVVGLTGSSSAEEEQQFVAAGADSVLVKPATRKMMLAMLHKYLA